MRYIVRCLIWQMEATSPEEAKKKAVDLLKSQTENLIAVETPKEKHGFWWHMWTGK